MSTNTARVQFFRGVKAELPILLGVVPFGLIYGILAIDAGLSAIQAQAMSVTVFAGSAQFVMAQLFFLNTPATVVVVTAILVNLRHALYSASIAPYVKHLPNRWRFGLAYLLTDEAYAVSIINYQRVDDLNNKHWFFLGAGLALWTTWQLSTATGILLGAQIPSSWPLDFFLALTFIALVVPALDDWAAAAAALVAGTLSVLAFDLPFKLGLVLAALVGVAAGMVVEKAASGQPPADGDQTAVPPSPTPERPEKDVL
jgi:4-azaleucine resistance transporter AzlC